MKQNSNKQTEQPPSCYALITTVPRLPALLTTPSWHSVRSAALHFITHIGSVSKPD